MIVLVKQPSFCRGYTPGSKAYLVGHLRMPPFLAGLACNSLIGLMGVAAAKKGLLCMQPE